MFEEESEDSACVPFQGAASSRLSGRSKQVHGNVLSLTLRYARDKPQNGMSCRHGAAVIEPRHRYLVVCVLSIHLTLCYGEGTNYPDILFKTGDVESLPYAYGRRRTCVPWYRRIRK